MADDDQDYDDGVFYEDDYLYVEDSITPADVLAEAALPSPPPVETIDDYFLPYDPYDYWMDIEYGSNEYYDVRIDSTSATSDVTTLKSKRKAGHSEEEQGSIKKRKTGAQTGNLVRGQHHKIWTGPNVVLMPSEQVYNLAEPCRACGKPKKYALLPNWKQLAESKLKSVREEDVKNEQQPAHQAGGDMGHVVKSQSSGKNPRQDSMQEESPETEQVDPAQLMSILKQSLSDQFPDADAAGNIEQMLIEMLSGENGASMDQILEKLTSSVMAQVEEGGASSNMGQWLTQRGVQLPEGSDLDEDEGSDQEHRDERDVSHPTTLQNERKRPRHRQEQKQTDMAEKPETTKGRKRKMDEDPDDNVAEQLTEQPAKRVTRSSRLKK